MEDTTIVQNIFFIYEPIEIKQILNVKESLPKHKIGNYALNVVVYC